MKNGILITVLFASLSAFAGGGLHNGQCGPNGECGSPNDVCFGGICTTDTEVVCTGPGDCGPQTPFCLAGRCYANPNGLDIFETMTLDTCTPTTGRCSVDGAACCPLHGTCSGSYPDGTAGTGSCN